MMIQWCSSWLSHNESDKYYRNKEKCLLLMLIEVGQRGYNNCLNKKMFLVRTHELGRIHC
jgi:hypothetical protein